jgi:hypothetical protein
MFKRGRCAPGENWGTKLDASPRIYALESCFNVEHILVPRALLTRGATRGSGQIHNRIPQKHGKKTMSGVRTSQSDASSDMDLARASRRTARKKGSGYENALRLMIKTRTQEGLFILT